MQNQQIILIHGKNYKQMTKQLLQAAGLGVAMGNATEEVKAAADHVTTCTCAEGAVGEYLYSLIGRAEGREV